jgi:hypothetical protein
MLSRALFALVALLYAPAYLLAEYDTMEENPNDIDNDSSTQEVYSDSCGYSSAEEYSNLMYDCCPGTPFSFYGQERALYWQPFGSNLHYVVETEPLPGSTPNWKISDIDPRYHWGFEIAVGAFIPVRNTRLDVIWTRFTSEDSDSKKVSSHDVAGPYFVIGPDASAYSRAKGRVRFNYDAFCIDYGVCFCLGEAIGANFFAGVGLAGIDQKLTTAFANSDGSIARKIKNPSSFFGAGPQVGMDLSYGICKGMQLTSRGVVSLLVGPAKNHTSYSSISPALAMLGVTLPNKQSTHVKERTLVVPAFEGKLGLAYNFCVYGLQASLEAGYEARLYISAIQSVDIGSEVVTPPVAPDTGGVYARTFQRNISNFALAGPYLNLTVSF